MSLLVHIQVADETGEVQYATQTVTVTERDAKALGQPVGSSTTVLLTAYPGGHSGGVDSGSESNQQYLSPPATTANVPNVQVITTGSYSMACPITMYPYMYTVLLTSFVVNLHVYICRVILHVFPMYSNGPNKFVYRT